MRRIPAPPPRASAAGDDPADRLEGAVPSPSFAFLLTLIALSLLFWLVTFKRTTGFTEPDQWMAEQWFPAIRSTVEASAPAIHSALLAISAAGSGWFVALGFAVLGVWLVIIGRRDLAWLTALGTLAFPVEWALKYFTATDEISLGALVAALFDVGGVGLDDLADFPAGHALRATVFYGIAAFALARLVGEVRRGVTGYAVGAGLVAAISITRLYLGAHYPIDVVGGWFAGLALLTILVSVHVMRVDERQRARAAARASAPRSRRVAVPRRPRPAPAADGGAARGASLVQSPPPGEA